VNHYAANSATRVWTAGTSGPQSVQTEPRSAEYAWGWVRISCPPGELVAEYAPSTGPNGGPVDCPCVIPVELPTTVRLTRRLTPGSSEVIASVDWGLGAPPACDRGRVVTLAAGVVLALAPWDSEVTLLDPAMTGSYTNAAGAVIWTFAGTCPRPLDAVGLLVPLFSTLARIL